jgi:outer membrane protein assembly factor BamD (BamD/ComL family)
VPRFQITFLSCALLGAALWGQQKTSPPKPGDLKEEDATLVSKEQYAFNPLQAEKELKVGNFYFKKGSYKAAAGRFREATKWNPTSAEAFLRLGEAEEKLKNAKEAKAAFSRFVELAPDDKRAGEVKKKLAGKG